MRGIALMVSQRFRDVEVIYPRFQGRGGGWCLVLYHGHFATNSVSLSLIESCLCKARNMTCG